MQKKLGKIIFQISVGIVFCLVWTSQSRVYAFQNMDSLQKILPNLSDTAKVLVLNQIAQFYWHSDLALAQENAAQAFGLAEEVGFKKGKGYALQNLGYISFIKGDYKDGLEYFFLSLRLFEEIKSEIGVSEACLNIGQIYKSQKNYEEALKYFSRAEEILVRRQRFEQLPTLWLNKGRVYKEQNNYDTALHFFIQASEEGTKYNEKVAIEAGNDIGNIYFHKQMYDQALESYHQTLEKSHALNLNEYAIASLNYIAQTYFQKGNNEETRDYSLQCLELAQKMQLKPQIMQVYQTLYQLYKKENNYPKALEYHEQFLIYKDSLFSEDKAMEIGKIKAQYELEQNDAQAALREKLDQANIHRQQIIITGIGIVLVILVISAIVLYRQKTKEHKIAELLKKQKTEIIEQNSVLQQQKVEIVHKNLQMEVQKNEILAQQESIQTQNRVLEESNKKITDSIRYAQTIQNALLPIKDRMAEIFADHFVLYKPKDIVSGDFYWLSTIENEKIAPNNALTFLAVADCTGHGVAGAFMSFIGYSLLNEIVNIRKIFDNSFILNELHKGVQMALRQEESDNTDGMDVGICRIWQKENDYEITFAGAKQNLYYVQNAELKTLKGSKKNIGGNYEAKEDFENTTVIVPKGTNLYLYSDGFADQNNAERNKIGSDQLRKTLLANANLSFEEQGKILEGILIAHQQSEAQRDDITVIGVQI